MRPSILLIAALSTVVPVAPAQRAPKVPPTIVVPSAPGTGARDQLFRDPKFGVSFHVPAGWEVSRKDGQLSTFHMDARSAPGSAQLRAVAIIDFNPFPRSTFSGALFYYSVEPRTSDIECARQATGLAPTSAAPSRAQRPQSKDTLQIAGMSFTHGHDEHGQICTEARDDVYTAWRKHTCYRFDLAMNTFCSVSSGAQEITGDQIDKIERRMDDILNTVVLSWEKPTTPTP
jgi:hypothetical protein